MASHTPSESSKTAEVSGDLSELLEQVEEMYKEFRVSPTVVVSKDSESGETKPWRSGRRLGLQKEILGSSEESPRSPPGQQAARTKIPNSRKFQPRPSVRVEIKPKWQEIDDLARCMRKIMQRPVYKGDVRLSMEDETKVRSVFEHHPRAEEKSGPGIDHFKIKEIIDEDTRCFWVVRKDGSEIDFSYHKCLKAKAAKECPDLLDHYASIYMDYRKRDAERAQREADKRNFDVEIE